MAKKMNKGQSASTAVLTLQDLPVNRGIHAALRVLEKAVEEGRQIADTVWLWVKTQVHNIRAKCLLETHRPDLLPANS